MIETDHDQVFYKSSSDKFGRGELEVAKEIAKVVPEDWQVVITMGAYRMYALTHEIVPEQREVQLDFYSVHPTRGYTPEQAALKIERQLDEVVG